MKTIEVMELAMTKLLELNGTVLSHELVGFALSAMEHAGADVDAAISHGPNSEREFIPFAIRPFRRSRISEVWLVPKPNVACLSEWLRLRSKLNPDSPLSK